MQGFRVLAALSVMAVVARPDDLTAKQILDRSRKASALGLVNARADVDLVVDDGHGNQRERRLTASAIEINGEVRRLIRFQDPPDVRGVAFLVVEKGNEPPQRFLYLPAQKRVRPVSGRQGSQSFENTDFAYADLDLAGGQADQLAREPDASIDNEPCWVISAVPPDSPYGKVITWVHQKTDVPLQIIFQDHDGRVLKRLRATRVKQVDGRWYAFESVMETLGRGSRTTLKVLSLDPRAALSPDDFTVQALERE